VRRSAGDLAPGWRAMETEGVVQLSRDRYRAGAVLLGVFAGAVLFGAASRRQRPNTAQANSPTQLALTALPNAFCEYPLSPVFTARARDYPARHPAGLSQVSPRVYILPPRSTQFEPSDAKSER
jgi:hypothetical protein